MSTDTTFNTNATSCANWSGSNLTVTNSGVLSSNGSGVVTAISASGSLGSLTNQGIISGTSVGTAYGVDNSGTITLLDNQLSITATTTSGWSNQAAAVNNGGTITSLTNGANGVISAVDNDTYDGEFISVYGIANSGHIGSIVNQGAITANYSATTYNYGNNAVGIYNGSGGSIDSINNSGTISGTVVAATSFTANFGAGISNDGGQIGTLTNSGTITGTDVGIYNSGSITSINNTIGGTISGDAGVVNDGGQIGTLTNSGTITGTDVGIYNSGSITGINNTIGGTIGGATGIVNDGGQIGTLTNSGTITGTSYAINTSGSIGLIINTGLIAGNIYNNSANVLSIRGDDSTYGTLTGASGGLGSVDKGTITSTSADVVLSNVVLNDDINASEHTVTVSTGTVKLYNTVSITGTYNQTGGSLLVVVNGANVGSLVVSDSATVQNSTITISGSNLHAGESLVVVQSGATGTYTGDQATVTGTSGLTASYSEVGQNLVVTLSAGTETSTPSSGYYQKGTAVNTSTGAIGHVLDQLAAGPNTAFQNAILVPLNALPVAEQGQAIKQLGPTQAAPAFQMTNAATSAVLGAVEQHQQTAMAYDPATGVAAGSESHDSALWGQMLGGGAVRGSNAEADGYKTTEFGLATGFDHRFTANAMGGVAFSWMRAWTGGADGSAGSSSRLDSYQLTLYGTYRQGPAFVDGQLGAGYNSFAQKRAVSYLGAVASADYGGEQYLARAQAGYDLPVGTTTVTPLAGLTWLRAVNDRYTENGAGEDNLTVARRGINSLTQDLGGKLSWTLATGLGTLKPEVRAEWVHDYTQGPIATSSLLAGSSLTTTTPRTAPDGVQFGLAATLNRTDSLSFRAEYQGEARAKYQSHTGMIKAVWGF